MVGLEGGASAHRSWVSRRIGATVALVALALVVAFGASRAVAEAHHFFYCGANINPGTWCGNTTNHSYDAQQNSSSVIPGGVCERMLFDTNPSMVRYPGPTCGPYNSGFHKYCYAAPGGTAFQFRVEGTHGAAGKAVLSGNAYYGTTGGTITC